LLAINYYLAQGGRLDILINIDGVNEAANGLYLSKLDIYPAYPYFWDQFFSTSFNPDYFPMMGKVLMWKSARQSLAKATLSLHYSVTVDTLWLLFDNYMEKQLIEARQELNSVHAASNKQLPPVVTGPKYLRGSSPDALNNFLANVWKSSSLEYLSQTHHFSYFHFLQPMPQIPDTKPLTDIEKRQNAGSIWIYKDAALKIYPLYEHAIPEMEKLSIPIYNLTHLFDHVTDTVYIDSCCHLNERGEKLLLNAIEGDIAGYYRQPATAH